EGSRRARGDGVGIGAVERVEVALEGGAGGGRRGRHGDRFWPNTAGYRRRREAGGGGGRGHRAGRVRRRARRRQRGPCLESTLVAKPPQTPPPRSPRGGPPCRPRPAPRARPRGGARQPLR